MKKIEKTAKTKKQKIAFGTNAVILMAVVIVVAVLLNLLVEQIPLNLDLTEEKLFTLTDTTEKILDELEDDIYIYALYDRVEGESESSKSAIIKVLDLYDKDDNVKVEYIDLNKKPAFLNDTVGASNARDYSSGDYIVKCGDISRRIDPEDMFTYYDEQMYFYTQRTYTGMQVENEVTGAIVRVTSDVPVIYWSSGYGEKPLDSSKYSYFVDLVEDSFYDLKTLDLRQNEIPEDASAIVFMGPEHDMDNLAVDKLTTWFDRKGGNAFFFMDVKDLEEEYIHEDFENFNLVFERFGLKINNDIVSESDEYKVNLEKSEAFSSQTLSVGALEKLPSQNSIVIDSRSIDILDTASDIQQIETILATSEDASSMSLDDESVSEGKKVVAASCEYTGGYETSKIVLFGSSRNIVLASDVTNGNRNFDVSFCGKIIKECVNWFDIETMDSPASDIQTKLYNKNMKSIVQITVEKSNTIAIIVAVVYPLTILIIGLIVWLRRRHL